MDKASDFKIGHILIKVLNLKEAVERFEQLGFTVTMGSIPSKATNAMIYFENGSFIELYTVPVEGTKKKIALKLLNVIKLFSPAKASRYINYVGTKEGMNDFALDCVKENSFGLMLESLNKRDFPVTKAIPMKRIDVKNCQIKWQMSFSRDARLPFFMDQYVPKVKLEKNQFTHKNGAKSIKELIISVDDYDYFIKNYQKLTSNFVEENEKSIFYFGDSSVVIEKGDKFQMKTLQLNGTISRNLPCEETYGTQIKLIKEEVVI